MSTCKVLVADDEEDIVETIRFGLEQEGYEVITASDGEEALRRVHEVQPDLILLDVMMPKENGYRVARKIRDGERAGTLSKEIRIILLTARNLHHNPEDERKVMEFSQADLMLYKPFDLDVLLQRVRSLTEE